VNEISNCVVEHGWDGTDEDEEDVRSANHVGVYRNGVVEEFKLCGYVKRCTNNDKNTQK